MSASRLQVFRNWHTRWSLPRWNSTSKHFNSKCITSFPRFHWTCIQIVYLTFNEAFTWTTQQYFQQIFDGQFVNPNGCPIRSTNFLSHEYSDYSAIYNYWTRGHEMAVISISHHNNITYWATINSTGWSLEMQGMREILNNFAMIPMEDVQGNQHIIGNPMTWLWQGIPRC